MRRISWEDASGIATSPKNLPHLPNLSTRRKVLLISFIIIIIIPLFPSPSAAVYVYIQIYKPPTYSSQHPSPKLATPQW